MHLRQHLRLRGSMAFLAMLTLATTAGCLESAYPVYDNETVVYKPDLIGVWETDKTSWTFTKRNDKSYRLTILDEKGREMPFIAHLAELDGALFLDIFPDGLDPKNQTFHDAHRFPVHSIYRVKAIGDQLKLSAMNIKELQDRLEEDPDVVDHVIVGKRLLLTAPTAELQKFLASSKDSFGGSIDFVRKSS